MEKTQNIQHWYIATYPKDELGPDISNEWTFPKLWHALNNSNKTIQEFSIILDWSDSIIRERVFAELAERKNVEYDVIYELWLKAAKEEREEKLYTADMKNGIINASLNFLTLPIAEARGFPVLRSPPASRSYTISPSVSFGRVPPYVSTHASRRSPSFFMLTAALMSRSWVCPHSGQVHDRTTRSLTCSFRYPQAEHSWDDG